MSNSASGGAITSRSELNSLLSPGAVTEDFESFQVTSGTATILDVTDLDSSTTTNGQGPNLIDSGVSVFAAGTGSHHDLLQWNGANYQGLTSKSVNTGGVAIGFRFTTSVQAFGVDVLAFSGHPGGAAAYIYASDHTTLLHVQTLTMAGGSSGAFLGYSDAAGIGNVDIFYDPRQALTTIILDNLTFGELGKPAAVPEPSSIAIFGFGAIALYSAMRKQKPQSATV